MMATDGYLFFAKELGAFHWDNLRARDAAIAAPLRASDARRRRW